MPDEFEVMTPVTKPEAVSMAEIHAMRGLTDAVSTLGRQVERMNGKLDDVRERVIKLESRDYERRIEALNTALAASLTRIDGLESTRDHQRGAKALVDWLRVTAPWLLAGIAAFVAGLGMRDGVPGA